MPHHRGKSWTASTYFPGYTATYRFLRVLANVDVITTTSLRRAATCLAKTAAITIDGRNASAVAASTSRRIAFTCPLIFDNGTAKRKAPASTGTAA